MRWYDEEHKIWVEIPDDDIREYAEDVLGMLDEKDALDFIRDNPPDEDDDEP
jgi:hypothetical protein